MCPAVCEWNSFFPFTHDMFSLAALSIRGPLCVTNLHLCRNRRMHRTVMWGTTAMWSLGFFISISPAVQKNSESRCFKVSYALCMCVWMGLRDSSLVDLFFFFGSFCCCIELICCLWVCTDVSLAKLDKMYAFVVTGIQGYMFMHSSLHPFEPHCNLCKLSLVHNSYKHSNFVKDDLLHWNQEGLNHSLTNELYLCMGTYVCSKLNGICSCHENTEGYFPYTFRQVTEIEQLTFTPTFIHWHLTSERWRIDI